MTNTMSDDYVDPDAECQACGSTAEVGSDADPCRECGDVICHECEAVQRHNCGTDVGPQPPKVVRPASFEALRASRRAPTMRTIERHPLRHDPNARRTYLIDLGWRSPDGHVLVETDATTTVEDLLRHVYEITDAEHAGVSLYVPFADRVLASGDFNSVRVVRQHKRSGCPFEHIAVAAWDEFFDLELLDSSTCPVERDYHVHHPSDRFIWSYADDTLVTDVLPDAARTALWDTTRGGWHGMIRCVGLRMA